MKPTFPRMLASVLVLGSLLTPAASAAAKEDRRPGNPRLAKARALVEQSDDMLHHSRLERGMTGYGLSVFAGTRPERFEMEVVSVMIGWGPHQDVILARLSGQGLEESGVIAGMSGSPCYVEIEGKKRLIGAVAYGWTAQKEPLCGIQPITQMLAASMSLDEAKQPADAAASTGADRLPEAFRAALLSPRKRDFSTWALPRGMREPRPAGDIGPRMAPLTTPLMVSGAGGEALDALGAALAPAGIVPMKAGGVATGKLDEDALRLAAGTSVSIPIVTGDADLSAVGTVTEVIDGRVLAFGHGFQTEGAVSLPMGPAYVHTVVSGLLGSFKLATTTGVTGMLQRDEAVAVVGTLGEKTEMVPFTLNVRWSGEDRPRRFEYQVVRHPWLTPLLAVIMAQDSVAGWHAPPEHHTIRYRLKIDFGELGLYDLENVASDSSISPVTSDLSRALVAMLHNPLGPPAEIERIDVEIDVTPGSRDATLLQLDLDGKVYRPGDEITGTLLAEPFREKRVSIPVRFNLPEDMPEGDYSLSAVGAQTHVSALQSERPHEFDPRTPEQLLASLRRVVQPQADKLYLRVQTPDGGGLAFGTRELPDLPASRRTIIERARRVDTHQFRKSIVRSIDTDYVINGAATAEFQVRDETDQTILHR